MNDSIKHRPVRKKTGKTIQNRLFTTYSLLMVVMLVVFLLFFYLYNSRLLRKQAIDAMTTLATVTMDAIDSELMKMDTVAMNICYSSLIKDQFAAYRGIESNTSPSQAERFNNAKVLADLFIAISGPNRTVQQINLYEPEGSMIGAGLYTQSIPADLKSKPWYDAVMAQNGGKWIVGPHEDAQLATDRYYSRKNTYVSLCRMYFASGRTYAGVIEIKQDAKTIFSAIPNAIGDHAQNPIFLVYSNTGDQVYPFSLADSDSDSDSEPTSESASAQSSNNDYSTHIQFAKPGTILTETIKLGQGREIVTHITSKWSEYTLLMIQQESTLFSPLFSFTRLFLLISTVLATLGLWLSYTLSKKLTTPIRNVHAAIRDLDLAALPDQPHRPVSSLNELEELNIAFSSMSHRLRDSLAELLMAKTHETQARMMALQAQMDPHFYHNTLSTISIMAEENMNKRIVEVCRHLSHMMRYIASESELSVSLGEEIDYAERYLQCMMIRYGSDLIFEVDVPASVRAVPVPKLIIQPLVENALKYGIHVDPPWKISIIGKEENGLWKISVTDNGPGFTNEALTAVRNAIDASHKQKKPPELEIDGMGLVSTYLRLNMYEKGHALFIPENPPCGGARVTIGGRVGG